MPNFAYLSAVITGVYQAKMKKYKDVADLVESSDAVNANIATKMKHYETLSEESMYKLTELREEINVYKTLLLFLEKSLQENNDIPRLLSGEMKEIIMAEILTLDESNLRDSLKRKYQVNFCGLVVVLLPQRRESNFRNKLYWTSRETNFSKTDRAICIQNRYCLVQKTCYHLFCRPWKRRKGKPN